MRFKDASHMNLDAFYARLPSPGRYCRWWGYALLVATVLLPGNGNYLWWCWTISIVSWLLAWRLEVGALWRSSLVSAFLLNSMLLAQRYPVMTEALGGGQP